MIRKLRRQFIRIATAAILVILVALIGVTTASMYGMVNLFVTRTLNEFNGDNAEDFVSKQLLGPLSRYDVFYYEITVDQNYKVISYDDSHHPEELNQASAENLASLVRNSQDNNRFKYDNSYYAWISDADGNENKLIIIDYTMVMNLVGQIRHISFLVGTAGFVLFEFLIIVLSNKAIQPALKNAENQKRFITNASHELKTPVAVISADNEVIEALHGRDEWTESISNQVKRLNSLISSLVQLAKSGEMGRAELQDTDISKAVRESTASYKPLLDRRKLKLETEIPDGIHARANDKTLSEIIGILLDNAAKYCDEGGCVKVRLEKSGLHEIIHISNDYEKGRDADYEKFFERFYREDASHNSASNGFGIGLSIAEELVHSMQAKIKAGWKEGRITFSIIL